MNQNVIHSEQTFHSF